MALANAALAFKLALLALIQIDCIATRPEATMSIKVLGERREYPMRMSGRPEPLQTAIAREPIEP